jgi:hypothetical protein
MSIQGVFLRPWFLTEQEAGHVPSRVNQLVRVQLHFGCKPVCSLPVFVWGCSKPCHTPCKQNQEPPAARLPSIMACCRVQHVGRGQHAAVGCFTARSTHASLSILCLLPFLAACRIPTQAPVWSVAWSRSNQQQLLLGLDKGRLAMVDLRMTGSRALLLVTGTHSSSSSSWPPGATAAAAAAAGGAAGGAPPSQPWHSLVMLEEGWGQSMGYLEQQEEAVMPEALMACPGRGHGTGVGVCCCPWLVLHAAALCARHGSPLSYVLSLIWE